MDDLKLSHVDARVNDTILDKLTERFGKLRTSRGKHNDFLRMQQDFSERRVLYLSMWENLEEALEEFQEEIKLVAATPLANDLSPIKEEENLNKEDMTMFHGIVA